MTNPTTAEACRIEAERLRIEAGRLTKLADQLEADQPGAHLWPQIESRIVEAREYGVAEIVTRTRIEEQIQRAYDAK